MEIKIPNIGIVNELRCPKCNLKLHFDGNESDYEEYDLFRFTHNAWFECPHCKKGFLVEDYTQRGRIKSVEEYLERHDFWVNKLTKKGKDDMKSIRELLRNLKDRSKDE